MGKYIKELYYITHIDNVPSILEHGIFSHSRIGRDKINFTPVYNEEIVSKRSCKSTPDGKSLWDFANLYFQARNPMLYKVIHDKSLNDIVVFGVRKNVMDTRGSFVTDGNAANLPTKFVPGSQANKLWKEIVSNTQVEWWSEENGSKRKIMAECLIPETIAPMYIETIYVANSEVRDKVMRLVPNFDAHRVVPEANMFFLPTTKISLKDNLWLVKGDMFFSRLQTLTISVNCIGVMGKGLASRAKYQFPGVYVHYQDLCRERKLSLGKPILYKREVSRDYELADEPSSLENGVVETWFLLFPTKDDWRNKADIKGIEKGLQWVYDNYKREGIKSLAMPALGCGLGWLDWSTVGPLLCTCLLRLDIETWVYLPTEKDIPKDQLDANFLLRNK
jgi:O-acetyl-ADP-ribose deacetylase (regulator of RNase III)